MYLPLKLTASVRLGDTSTVSYLSLPLLHSSSLLLFHISSLCLFHSSSLCLTTRISCSTRDWLLRDRSLKNGFDVKVLSWASMDTGAELRQNSEALRMIRLEVSTTMMLAEDTVSRLTGPPAVESMRFLEVEAEQSGSRIMTLLAVISWYTDLGRGDEEEEGDGETDKDGVRQAGGLGGARPVCRVDGLNMENDEMSLKFGCFLPFFAPLLRPFSHSLAFSLTYSFALIKITFSFAVFLHSLH